MELVAKPVLVALFSAQEDPMAVMRRNNGWAFVTRTNGPDGTRQQVWRSGFRTKRDAVEAERRFLVEADDRANQPHDVAVDTLSVAAFLADWLVQSRPTRRDTTSESYDKMVREHIAPYLGEITLTALSADDVRRWHGVLLVKPRRFRPGPLSSTTVRMCHRILRRALQDALRWGLVDRNVCDAVIAPRNASVEMRTWSASEARAFLESVADDRLAAMWRLFVSTGMRRGEVAGLRWADLDLDQARLTVRVTRVLVYDKAVVSEPKTRRSRRSIVLDAGTVEALRRHREAQGVERERAAEAWEESGYVFVREDGRPLDPDRISHLFGVRSAAAVLPPIRLHDLRHTAATLALGAGVHPKIVSERLGHSSIAITLDTYSHVLPSMQTEAAATLGALLDSPS